MIPSDELAALREGAGLVDLSERGHIAVTGEDRARWLHAMVSNHIQELAPGEGCYCFLLDAQGHIQADAYVRVEAERIMLSYEGSVTKKLLAQLDNFIFMDQVELADLSASLGTMAVIGPRATAVLGTVPQGVYMHRGPVFRVEDGFWIIAPPDELAGWRQRLEAAGAKPVGHKAWNHRCIENGIPRLGLDIGATTLAQETGQIRAVHFRKGCYLGQEIVERVRSRGRINRHLAGFKGDGLTAGAKVTVDGKEAGWITSVSEDLALGYLRREFATPGTAVQVDSHTATVRSLPSCVFDW
jgi:aminomethyltransferase